MLPTLATANTSSRDWAYACDYMVYILNESTTASLPGLITRNQVWNLERVPSVDEMARLEATTTAIGRLTFLDAYAT